MASNNSREFPERPLVGVGVIIVGDQGVALIKRGKPPRAGSWSLPGGAQKLGETVNEAARREALEETGLKVEVQGLVDVVDSITKADDERVQYHYTLVDVLATTAADAQPQSGGDASDAKWFGIDEIPSLGLWKETERVILKAHAMWQGNQAVLALPE